MTLTRRDVLLGAGGAALLAACGGKSGTAAPGPATSGAPSAGSASPVATASQADLASLARSVPVLQKGSAGFDQARLLFNRRFDATVPDAVAQVTSEAQVAACVGYARDTGTPLRVRSGGHSYTGGSTGSGLVVDLRALKDVQVGDGTATVGAGAALIDVYAALAAKGVAIPSGSCPAVGIGGITLGGGMGVVGRKHGLTCDALTSAQVVLASGRTVTASKDSEPDLFFALRGGGGSFGLVTSMTFTTHPTTPVSLFFLSWPFAQAEQVVRAWQEWAPQQPDEVWSTCAVLATLPQDGGPTVTVSGVDVGPSGSLTVLLDALVGMVGSAPNTRSVNDSAYGPAMMTEASCASLTQAACAIQDYGGPGTLPRDAFTAASDFFSAAVPAAGVSAMVAAVQARQDAGLGVGGVAFDSWGGAVNTVAAADTAFVHRSSQFAAQYTASWGAATAAEASPGMTDNSPADANQQSLATLVAALHPHANGEAYQNYADATLANPLQAYYGSNLARLQGIKRAYDPGNLFAPPLGITP